MNLLNQINEAKLVTLDGRQHPSHLRDARANGQRVLAQPELNWEVVTCQRWRVRGRGPCTKFIGEASLAPPGAPYTTKVYIRPDGSLFS
jgi:hypothetical protein